MSEQRKRQGVLIVDDHALIRESLTARIAAQADMTVLGETEDAEEALTLLERVRPAFVTIGLEFHDGRTALDLIKAIKTRFPATRTLVVSGYPQELFAERALRAGAHGYISKKCGSAEVVEALRLIGTGERYISKELRIQLALRPTGDGADGDVAALSDRELQIFRLIGEGKSTSMIAARLHLSVHTIASHRENIRFKLNLKTGGELTQRAVRWVIENGY